jgi:hypothetical protein
MRDLLICFLKTCCAVLIQLKLHNEGHHLIMIIEPYSWQSLVIKKDPKLIPTWYMNVLISKGNNNYMALV